ncbi:TRAP transporter small permease [Allorhizobium borbori]|uniref:TRAP transporter small permease protein n=1 Tax=Allorhizobium borbori TaxID=485907 RepID=A0A7W6K3F1_9HYPH|nr:TRAP transporter small permease [Allorhizobium borbori]MBB4104478.1 TRAP-type C4-dicarboxylate transport system permease small subunit [Allorhizobium borbori]
MGASQGVKELEELVHSGDVPDINATGIGARVGNGVLLIATFCFLAGTGVTVMDVALRALLGRNLPGAIETTALTVGLGALLSIPACYLYRGHVTAKLLSEIAPGLFAKPLGLFGAFCSLMFAVLMFAILVVNLREKIGSPETTSDLQLTMWMLLGVITAVSGVGVVAALRALFSSGDTSKVLDN